MRNVSGGRAWWLMGACVAASAAMAAAGEEKKASPWEKEFAAMEEADAKTPPPTGEIVLAGSSSARMWDVKKCFPDLKVVNRGFGGSQITDSTQFAARIILPLKPRVILFYAGDNDVAGGKAPERVLEDYKAFVKTVRDALPETKVVFICIKPSTLRWRLWEKIKAANALIEEFTKTDKLLAYVDVATPMLGDDGKPKAELLAKDGLHLTPAGYELWTKLVLPHLK